MDRDPTSGYVMIFLASNEWNNETMQRVAKEYFATNPSVNFVEVHEHGGWFLGYRRDMTIWSTANDSARLSHPRPQPTHYLKDVRRV